jgi:hypothetical protein
MTPADYEIIVNNDSNDIEEIHDHNVTYHYKQSDNLGEIYKFLFDQAQGEYVYFMEDDDMMHPNFYNSISLFDEDIIFGNYVPYKWDGSFIDYMKSRPQMDKEEFLEDFDPHHYQFSQILFRKKALAEGDFPVDNHLQNDFVIFQRLQGTFRITNTFFYKQTVDGKDNISFKEYCKDPRWTL